MSGWVAGAVVVAGVAGAVGSSVAAGKAASATRSAANTAATEQQNALNQQEAIAQPYVNQGKSGIATYNALTEGSAGQINNELMKTPGYQVTYGQGVEAAERAAAASGLNLSGNQVAGVEQFGAQLGDTTYQQAINNALGQEQIGQAAAAGTAANIGTAATNEGQIAINQGNNIANIDSNEIAGITRAGSGAVNQYLTYQTLNNLINPGGGNPTYTPNSSTSTMDLGGNQSGYIINTPN